MSSSSRAATDSLSGAASPASDAAALERPVLTVTGAVGLLVGSLAWAVTGQFAAAPLVFAASLTTALALAVVLEDRAAASAETLGRLTEELRATRSRLDVLEPVDRSPAAAAAGRRDLELNDLLWRGASSAAAAASERGVTLRIEPSPLYLAVHVHQGLIERTFASLLNSAVAASPGAAAVHVRTVLEGDRAVAEVETADIALYEAPLPEAFGWFDAADAATERSRTGAFNEDAAPADAGRLSVRRTSGGGRRYTLSLPFGHQVGRRSPRVGGIDSTRGAGRNVPVRCTPADPLVSA